MPLEEQGRSADASLEGRGRSADASLEDAADAA